MECILSLNFNFCFYPEGATATYTRASSHNTRATATYWGNNKNKARLILTETGALTKLGQITLPVSHAYIYNQCIFVRVCQFLSSTTTISTINSSSITRKLARRKKTNRLLISASIIFFISWAPINIFVLVLDIFSPFDVSRLFSYLIPHSSIL